MLRPRRMGCVYDSATLLEKLGLKLKKTLFVSVRAFVQSSV